MIDTTYLNKCILALELANNKLKDLENDSLEYRDNRNSTSHDYGQDLANETLKLIPQFIDDSKKLVEVINSNAS